MEHEGTAIDSERLYYANLAVLAEQADDYEDAAKQWRRSSNVPQLATSATSRSAVRAGMLVPPDLWTSMTTASSGGRPVKVRSFLKDSRQRR